MLKHARKFFEEFLLRRGVDVQAVHLFTVHCQNTENPPVPLRNPEFAPLRYDVTKEGPGTPPRWNAALVSAS